MTTFTLNVRLEIYLQRKTKRTKGQSQHIKQLSHLNDLSCEAKHVKLAHQNTQIPMEKNDERLEG